MVAAILSIVVYRLNVDCTGNFVCDKYRKVAQRWNVRKINEIGKQVLQLKHEARYLREF